jgi:hypothetical protein
MRQYRAKAEERCLMDLTACFEKIFQCKKQTDMSRFLNALRKAGLKSGQAIRNLSSSRLDRLGSITIIADLKR